MQFPEKLMVLLLLSHAYSCGVGRGLSSLPCAHLNEQEDKAGEAVCVGVKRGQARFFLGGGRLTLLTSWG